MNMKRILAVIIILCLLLSNNVTAIAAVTDITAPIISNINLDKNGAILVIGDTITLSFDAVDESSVAKIHMSFRNFAIDPRYGYISFDAQTYDSSLSYDNITKKYEAKLTIPSSIKNGEWKLSSTTLFDEYNNFAYNQTVPELSFSVTNGVPDITAPVVTDVSIDKNRNNLSSGDSFIFSFKAADESLLKRVDVSFIRSTDQMTYQSFYASPINETLTFNSITNKYEMVITIPNLIQVGEWNFSSLYVYDIYDNFYDYSNLAFSWDADYNYITSIISDLGFTITNGITDVTAPIFSDITIDKNEGMLACGDTLKISFEAEDESLIKYVTAYFYNSLVDENPTSFMNNSSNVSFTYNSKDCKYEMIITIPDTMKVGEWNLEVFSVTDEYGNFSIYDNRISTYVPELDDYIHSYEQNLKFYLLDNASTPVADTASGNVSAGTQIILKTATQDAEIYYTTDGSTPSRSSYVYKNPIVVTNSSTIKAIAVKNGLADSNVMSVSYTIMEKVAAPTANPSSGSVIKGSEVTLSTATTGATIYYTLDGSTPSTSSTAYTAPIKITTATTLRAIAVKSNMSNSNVLAAEYVINTSAGGSNGDAPPVIPPYIPPYIPPFIPSSDTPAATEDVMLDQDALTITGLPTIITVGDSTFNLSTSGGSGTGSTVYEVTSGNAVSISGNTVTILNAGHATIAATKAGDSTYNEATTTINIIVNKAEVIIEELPNVKDIVNNGESLSAVKLIGGKASVPGKFVWSSPDMILSKTDNYLIAFIPTDSDNYFFSNNPEITVTVSAEPKSITFDTPSKIIALDQTYAQKAIVDGGRKDVIITYASSKPSVATVNSAGRVKPLKEGKTYISAETSNGIIATYEIVVKKAPVNITLSNNSATLLVGKTLTLKPSVGNKYYATFTFKSSNPSVATISSNGKITAKKSGKTIITIMTHNGLKITCKITVKEKK